MFREICATTIPGTPRDSPFIPIRIERGTAASIRFNDIQSDRGRHAVAEENIKAEGGRGGKDLEE